MYRQTISAVLEISRAHAAEANLRTPRVPLLHQADEEGRRHECDRREKGQPECIIDRQPDQPILPDLIFHEPPSNSYVGARRSVL